jgi:hypothetical protein
MRYLLSTKLEERSQSWDPFLRLGPFGHTFVANGDEEFPLATHRHVQAISQPQVTILAV